MIVEVTEYFAKPGMADKVLDLRRRASEVRRSLGLPSGRVYRRAGDGDNSPDVVWQCTFADTKAQAKDIAARGESPAFTAIREEMRQHVTRFVRSVMESDPEPLANGLRWVDLGDQPIVPREVSFQHGGHDLKGYFFAPPGEGPFPCMICNHGSTIAKGTLDVSRPGMAALLASWGIASFLPHRHGYGNSSGPHWREEARAAFGTPEYDAQLCRRLDRESEDVLAALDCLSAFAEVDAAHVGVMGSSFGGTNTLLAASQTDRFTCAVEFAGAAMNWDSTPKLREMMTKAAHRLTMPIFFIQAKNDYSARPTKELAEALVGTDKVVWAKLYPDFGVNPEEGHLLESRGAQLWGDDVRHFLELHL